MSVELHTQLLRDYYQPFHKSVQALRQALRAQFSEVFHLDLHSMPSVGTSLHPDPGEARAEVVVSDQHGESADAAFKDLVMDSLQAQSLQVAYNWPYVGGGITQTYGDPKKGFHTVQIELNRALYMDEHSKQLLSEKLPEMQARLQAALAAMQSGLKQRING
jgi:N-formylglutamate amidohydrolase